MNCIRINMKIIGYRLFMKPPPQLLKTYVIILHIFDIVSVLRYNFAHYNTKIHRKMSRYAIISFTLILICRVSK